MTLRRSHVSLTQRILAPAVKSPQGCLCLTCGRLVDSENLVEGEPGRTTYAEVLVKHHGAEELRRFDMGSVEWDSYELKSHMMRANWFSPYGHEDAGLGRKVTPDMVSDPEPTRVHSTACIVGADGKPLA